MRPLETSVSYRDIAAIALPMMVSGISLHLIGLADTVFLARVGEVELGAAGNSILLYYTVAMSLSGICLGAQIIMGRRNGEGNYGQIGMVFKQSALFLLLITAMAWALLFFATHPLVGAIYKSQGVVTATISYMKIRAFGLFPTLANFLFTAFYVGITKTRPLAFVTPLQATINIILDYLLIFGIGPFPEMGIEGAALASVIAELSGTCFFIMYMLFFTDRAKYGLLSRIRMDREALLRIWKLGNPLVAQNFIAIGSWFVFFSIVERLGERPLAVSHIVRAIYLIIAIPLTSWADATNTIVSNLIGRNRAEMIIPTIRKIALLVLLVDLLYLALLNAAPARVIGMFTTDASLVSDTIPSLRVISFSTILFSLSLLAFRALAGSGLTALCMRIEMAAVFLYLAAGFSMVLWFEPSTAEVWCTEFIYFAVLGGFSLYYLLQKKYNTSEV